VRRLCLIVNPHAGGGRTAGALPGVESVLRDRGHEVRVERTLSLEHAIELSSTAAACGEVAVSFGGDGLAGACAHALRETDGVLGVLPGGRGNDFARKLGIPLEPVEACAVLTDGVERTVDVGDVDGRTFLGIASYGFDSAVQDIANASRVKGGLVYPYATLRAMATWKRTRLTWSADGGPERSVVGYAVAACNSGMFGGGMALAPDADLEDGQFDVIITGEKSKLGYLSNLPRVFKGTHITAGGLELFRARELRVSAETPFRIYADGDPIGTTPATIRTIPAALKVLVPR
jgi:YegS/Rv2252/BmrU family lipid kinase